MTGDDFSAVKRAALNAMFGAQAGNPEDMRAVYAALGNVLRAYAVQFTATGATGSQPQIFPPEIAASIAAQFEYLARGIIPGPMLDCVKPGASARGPLEESDIRAAAAYIGASQRAIIDDRSPFKTVAAAYGVTPRTVHNWHDEFLWLDDYAAPGPEALTLRMQAAGARYRQTPAKKTLKQAGK